MAFVRIQGLHGNSTKMPKEGKFYKSICSFCNGGCGLKVQVDPQGRVIAVYGDDENPYNQGKICAKPVELPQILYCKDRVAYPLKKVNGEFVRIEWDEAIETIAQKHKEYIEKNETGSVIGITAKIGGSYSKLALSIFSGLTGMANYGTGPICFSSEEKVRSEMFGKSAASAPLHDVVNAKMVVLVGNNCGQTKAGQFHWLQRAREQGTKIVVIDSRYTETAQQADQFIRIRPGTDAALGMALLHYVIKNKLYDEDFVQNKINGFNELAESVAEFTPQKAAEITGIPQDVIEELAINFGNRKPTMLWPGRGIICVNNAESSLMAFESLMAILGNFGKPGSGVISHLNGYGKPKTLVNPEDVKKPSTKRSPVDIYSAMENGEIKMLYIAGNPCANWPDSNRMKKAIENVEFVVANTLVLDESSRLADIVIPATHWLEEAGMQANIHRMMQWKDQVAEPYGESKSGGEIYRSLAEKMGLNVSSFPRSAAEAWEFERTNIPSISAISVEKMQSNVGGLHYPYPQDGKESHILYSGGVFNTPSKKVELLREKGIVLKYVDPFKAPGNKQLDRAEYPYLFSSVKVAAHYHTQCQYSEWAREIEKPYVEVHPETAAKIGVKNGENIRIETSNGSLVIPAKLTYSVPEDALYTQPFFGLKLDSDPVNVLFPIVTDQVGGNFIHKNILCKAYPERGQES